MEKPVLEDSRTFCPRWERDGTTDSTAPVAPADLLDRRRRRRSAAPFMSATSSPSRIPISSRGSSMRGKEVFYPMGWDDNGLPTERRVQNYFGVRCDPSLPYDRPSRRPTNRTSSRSRSHGLTSSNCAQADHQGREGVRSCGAISLSVDWSMTTRPLAATRSSSRRDVRAAAGAGSPTRSKRRRCGTSTSAPRWRRPSSRIASSPARATKFISTGAGSRDRGSGSGIGDEGSRSRSRRRVRN